MKAVKLVAWAVDMFSRLLVQTDVEALEGIIRLNVVIVDGMIRGKTISDEWNLQSIGARLMSPRRSLFKLGFDASLLENLRQLAKDTGFQIHLHTKNATYTQEPSVMEREALGECGLSYALGEPCSHDWDEYSEWSASLDRQERGLAS